MSYRVTKADEAKPYEAAGHYNNLNYFHVR